MYPGVLSTTWSRDNASGHLDASVALSPALIGEAGLLYAAVFLTAKTERDVSYVWRME
jgi:hypothetical protein